MSQHHLTFIQSFTITGKNMIYLYHSFHVLRLLLNIRWLIVRKEIEQRKMESI